MCNDQNNFYCIFEWTLEKGQKRWRSEVAWPLTIWADFWLVSVEAGWLGTGVSCCAAASGCPGDALHGEGWASGGWVWPGCLRRAGRWGAAGLDGVCAACGGAALTTEEEGVACCWDVSCACGAASAFATCDAAEAAVSAPAAAAGCTV